MGFITDALGLTNYEGQEEAMNQSKEQFNWAKQQADKGQKFGKEMIDYYKQQYNNWNNIFGGIQGDLGTYFHNLTGDKHLAMQMTQLQKQEQIAQQQMQQAFASRGLEESGLQADEMRKLYADTARAKATAAATSDAWVAQQKMGYMRGIGFPQLSQINNGLMNAYGSTMNAFTQGAGVGMQSSANMMNIYGNLSRQNQDSMGGLFGLGLNYMHANKII